MRVFLLIAMCASVSSCGLIHRSANIARSIYTENTVSSSSIIMALDDAPAAPAVTIDGVLPIDDETPTVPPENLNASGAALNNVEPAAAPPQEEDFALYLPNGEIFSPLCFLNNIGSLEYPVHPTSDCGRENIHPLTEQAQHSVDRKTVFIQYTVDLPPEEEKSAEEIEPQAGEEAAAAKELIQSTQATEQPKEQSPEEESKPKTDLPKQSGINQISYTNIGNVKGFFAIKITNILYTGEIINSLGLYDFSIDSEDRDTLERKKSYADGDRCIAGLDAYSIDSTGELRYSVRHTPKTLFMLPFLKNDNQMIEMDTKLADLPACPTCCLGTYEYIDEIPSTFTFDDDYIIKAKAVIAQAKKQQEEKELRDRENGIKKKIDEIIKISPLECVNERLIAIYDKGLKSLAAADVDTLHNAIISKCYITK